MSINTERYNNLKTILVDANTLRKNNIQKSHIDEILTDIVADINSKLKTAKSIGEHHIITDIPLVFSIPNTCTRDAQRIIWSSLISLLKSKNYNVIINHNKEYCRLKITWLTQTDETLIKSQLKLLRDCQGTF
jgi:hypothetical protein